LSAIGVLYVGTKGARAAAYSGTRLPLDDRANPRIAPTMAGAIAVAPAICSNRERYKGNLQHEACYDVPAICSPRSPCAVTRCMKDMVPGYADWGRKWRGARCETDYARRLQGRGRQWTALAYVDGHADARDAAVAKALTLDEARGESPANIATLPEME
jgi:hypothetical protein